MGARTKDYEQYLPSLLDTYLGNLCFPSYNSGFCIQQVLGPRCKMLPPGTQQNPINLKLQVPQLQAPFAKRPATQDGRHYPGRCNWPWSSSRDTPSITYFGRKEYIWQSGGILGYLLVLLCLVLLVNRQTQQTNKIVALRRSDLSGMKFRQAY